MMKLPSPRRPAIDVQYNSEWAVHIVRVTHISDAGLKYPKRLEHGFDMSHESLRMPE